MNDYKNLTQKFKVDTENGIIYNLYGKKLGGKNKAGYIQVWDYEYKKNLLAHRIIYQVHHGLDEIPKKSNGNKMCINHINGVKDDNRIENLELITHKENSSWTHKVRSDNSTGFKGVSYDKKREGYHSYLTVSKKRKYLGFYKTAEEAAGVYQHYVNENKIYQPENGCKPKEKPSTKYGPDLKYDYILIDGKKYIHCDKCDKNISYSNISEHLKTKSHLGVKVEKIKTDRKNYYENNKEDILLKQKEYYENNKEDILLKRKEYYENNKETIKKRKAPYQKEYNNTPERKQKMKDYFEKNKETSLAYRKGKVYCKFCDKSHSYTHFKEHERSLKHIQNFINY